MGCLSHRRRDVEVRPEQKWDYISLQDFKSTNCFTPLAYAYLYMSLLLSLAVYSVDTFTAVQLLVFDKWSSQIEPTQLISFDVSKWIFSICIILSFINLAYEHLRANRIMRRGSVAESYLDNLAVKLESIRFGKGRGWKRFLVFAELTKSKKGAEYIALFTYFSFQSWIRVLVCSGPRQAVNALTLLAVYNAKLSASGDSVENTLMDFFNKIKSLATEDYQQALILSGMLFTLVVWVFSALSLLLAVIFFVFFLWSWIPRADGGLSGYCERKINKRLMKIVSVKVNKAIAEEERQRKKAELKAAKKAGEAPPEERKATLPVLDGSDDSLPAMPMLNRTDTGLTTSTLPAYTPGPGTPSSFELNSIDQKRPLPSRTGTMSSNAFSSKASLLGNAAEPAGFRSASPAPSLPQIDLSNYPLQRPGTSSSNRSFGGPPQMGRVPTNGSGFGAQYTQTPSTYSSETMPSMPPPVRSPTAPPADYGGMPRLPFDGYPNGRSSPAPSVYSNRGGPQPPRGPGPSGPFGPGGMSMPLRSATNPVPSSRGPGPQYSPQRNMTAPIEPRHQAQGSNGSGISTFSQRQGPNGADYRAYSPAPRAQNGGEGNYFNRPSTAQSQQNVSRPGYGNRWNDDVEAQRGRGRY
ncbi:Pheromone-regulated membrane protein [Pleurostoma richardsiae]|uniref:Pheromone-regulated membrane protein n=1 Tax=Pleurostoma richardsiae TaxID=41990 RepID=A0AA38VX11_9PEZI|nr:Pheromone-regulated membrane protein [Pleurostoma richardsiae]